MTNLETLLRRAAEIGSATKDSIERNASALKDAQSKRDAAQERVNEGESNASGFDAPRFTGLAEVAHEWARMFNDPYSADAVAAVDAARGAFVASFTNQTEKSAKGGKNAGYSHVIRLGGNAEMARAALARRVNYWRGVHDSSPEGESPSEARDRKANAKRYYTVNSSAPTLTASGEWPQDDKGAPIKPKYRGRPATTVRGVGISHAKATTRDSQMTSFAQLFAQYGDVVLMDDVVDAFLDNGGRYVEDGEQSLASLCDTACDTLDKIMAQGGSASGDAAFIAALHATLKRIGAEGFKSSRGADAQPVDSAPETESQAEPEALLDSVLGDAPEADQPAEVLDTTGVVLGAPVATLGTTRPRRTRKGQEVAA